MQSPFIHYALSEICTSRDFFCVQARRKLRYLKDMQILYGIDSKRRMISEVFHDILEACNYGITLDLSASNGYSSKFLFINLESEFYIPSL